jgi:hypothetical protein
VRNPQILVFCEAIARNPWTGKTFWASNSKIAHMHAKYEMSSKLLRRMKKCRGEYDSRLSVEPDWSRAGKSTRNIRRTCESKPGHHHLLLISLKYLTDLRLFKCRMKVNSSFRALTINVRFFQTSEYCPDAICISWNLCLEIKHFHRSPPCPDSILFFKTCILVLVPFRRFFHSSIRAQLWHTTGKFKLDSEKCPEVLNAHAFGKSKAHERFGFWVGNESRETNLPNGPAMTAMLGIVRSITRCPRVTC